jgi:glutamate racemase
MSTTTQVPPKTQPMLLADASAMDMGWSSAQSKKGLLPDSQGRNDGQWHKVNLAGGGSIEVRFARWKGNKPVFEAKGQSATIMKLEGFQSFSAAASNAAERTRGGALKAIMPNPLQAVADIKAGNQTLGQRANSAIDTAGKLLQNTQLPLIGITPKQAVRAYNNSVVPAINNASTALVGRPVAAKLPAPAGPQTYQGKVYGGTVIAEPLPLSADGRQRWSVQWQGKQGTFSLEVQLKGQFSSRQLANGSYAKNAIGEFVKQANRQQAQTQAQQQVWAGQALQQVQQIPQHKPQPEPKRNFWDSALNMANGAWKQFAGDGIQAEVEQLKKIAQDWPRLIKPIDDIKNWLASDPKGQWNNAIATWQRVFSNPPEKWAEAYKAELMKQPQTQMLKEFSNKVRNDPKFQEELAGRGLGLIAQVIVTRKVSNALKGNPGSAIQPIKQTPTAVAGAGQFGLKLQEIKGALASLGDKGTPANAVKKLQEYMREVTEALKNTKKGTPQFKELANIRNQLDQRLSGNLKPVVTTANTSTNGVTAPTSKPIPKPTVATTPQVQNPVVPPVNVNTVKPKPVTQPTSKPNIAPVQVAPVPGNVPIEPAISTSGVRIYKLQDGNVGSVSLSQSGQGDVVPKNSNTAVKPKPNDDDNPWGMSLGPDGQPRITPPRQSPPPTTENPTTGNNNNQPPNKPPTKKTGGTPPDDDSSISKSPNNTQKTTPTSTPTVRSQAVATGDEVVKTVDLFTKPGSALTPDMQFKLNPMLSKFMERFEGRDFSLFAPDSSAGGRIAIPTLLKGFEEATGTFPSVVTAGDDRNAPYGNHTQEKLVLHTNEMFTVGRALKPDCMAGVCNTLHGAIDRGIAALEDPSSPPYVHLIRTTANAMKEAAANGDTKQVLLATQATVDSGIYTRHIAEVSGGQLKVTQIAAPDFAPAVNRGDHLKPPGSPERIALDKAADQYIQQIPADATSVWLCCTHYPALTSTIQDALNRAGKGHIKIVDPMREQGIQVGEEFWEWKLSGGAKTPGVSFDSFMISSADEKDMGEIRRLGDLFYTQGDPNKATVPLITLGDYATLTPDGLQQAINTLPGRKPEIDPSKLPVQPNTPTGNQTPPVNAANVPTAEVPQNPNPPLSGNTTAQATPVWNQPGLSAANQKSIADSYAKYQQAGGTKTPEQFFNGTPQDPGVMQIFDEAKFLRGQAPSIPAIAETMATNQVAAAAFVAKEQALLNDAYESYSLTAQYHPYRDKAPVLDPEPFVTKLSQEYLAAGGKDSTGKTLGEFAVEKYPPLATSAFFQNPLEMAKRFPHLPLDERDKIVSLAQKTELLQREIIPHYKANPIIENGQKLVWHNPVTNRLEVDSNFLVYDPRANGVFPDGTKPAMDLNALIGRTDRYDLPSKLVQITIPATRPASVDPATNNQYIRPGFEHTNNKWVLSATENAYLPKVFAADPRLQAIEAQKKAVQANRGLSNHQIRTEVASLDAQAAPIKAELTETYLAKRRNWASFVIHALEVLRLPRTEVAAMLADQQIPSPPPPIGGPRSINVPQMAGSGVQPVKDPVTGLNTVTYVDLRNIKPQELARGDFSSADIETRGPSFVQAASNSNHRRGEVTKNIALTALFISGANLINTTFIQPALKKPDPLPTPPIEKLAASVTESNRTMLGLALQRGILQNKLDRITLPKVGLSLYLSPVGNLPKGADRPTFVQLVETLMQTNPQILKESGVDTTKLLESARQLDAAKVQTGSGTTIPPQPKKTP